MSKCKSFKRDLTFEGFCKEMKYNDEFYYYILDRIEETGGLNYWDSQDYEEFYELYLAMCE